MVCDGFFLYFGHGAISVESICQTGPHTFNRVHTILPD